MDSHFNLPIPLQHPCLYGCVIRFDRDKFVSRLQVLSSRHKSLLIEYRLVPFTALDGD